MPPLLLDEDEAAARAVGLLVGIEAPGARPPLGARREIIAEGITLAAGLLRAASEHQLRPGDRRRSPA
jgi:hypothetical protein